MKTIIALILFTQPLFARDLLIEWKAPTEREDNTILKPEEIKEFHMYWGAKAKDYPNELVILGSAESVLVKNLPDQDLYIVLTTVDTDGRESVYSTEIVKTFDIDRPDKVDKIVIEK